MSDRPPRQPAYPIGRVLIWLVNHPTYALLPTFIIIALCIVSVGSIKIREDVLDVLPADDPVFADFFAVIERFELLNYTYVLIRQEGGSNSGTLARAGDATHAAMIKSGLFDDILYRFEMEDIFTSYAVMLQHRAALFTTSDQAALEIRLTPEAIDQTLREWRRTLADSPTPVLANLFYSDPLTINDIFAEKLNRLSIFGKSLTLSEGRLSTADMKGLLIIARPSEAGSEGWENHEFVDKLTRIIETIELEYADGGVDIAWFSGHRASMDNSGRLKRDVRLTIAISLTAIALLSLLVYRRFWLAVLTFAPVAFGALFALGVMRWLDPFIAAISIGCGAMLIGISVDYAIHLIYGADHPLDPSDEQTDNCERLAHIVSDLHTPILLSAATTFCAFGVMHASIIPGYRSLGHFGALGIAGAAGFTLIALPALLAYSIGRTDRQPLIRIDQWLNNNSNKYGSRRTTRILAVATACIVTAFGIMKVRFDGDVQALNALLPDSQADLQQIQNAAGDIMHATAIAVQHETLQGALQAQERFTAHLRRIMEDGTMISFVSLAELLPSEKSQRKNMERWRAFWSESRQAEVRNALESACIKHRIDMHAIDDFLDNLLDPTPPITPNTYDRGPLKELVKRHIRQDVDRTSLLVRAQLADDVNLTPIRDQLASDGENILIYSGPAFIARMIELIQSEMIRLGIILGVVLIVLVVLAVRSASTVLAIFTPLLLSGWWTLGILGLFDVPVNLMNGVVVVFIFGLTIDYSIFLALAYKNSGEESRVVLTRVGILISALTTMCGMGALVFAYHPALHSIGLTALIGITSGICSVFLVVPMFVRKQPPVRTVK